MASAAGAVWNDGMSLSEFENRNVAFHQEDRNT